MRLEQLVNKHHERLNDNDLYVIKFIKKNLEFCIDNIIAEIAKHASISQSTIIRTTKKLGFHGYSEFRYFLKNELEAREETRASSSDLFNTSTILGDIKSTIQLFEKSSDAKEIYSLINKSKRIFAYATGHGQELMLKEFSRTLVNSNVFLIFVPSKSELEIVAENLTENDLLFVVSLSGNIESIDNILQSVILNDTPIVSVTSFSSNKLSPIANYNLYYQVSNINPKSKLNNTSYCTLSLVLSLLYEGYINYNKGM